MSKVTKITIQGADHSNGSGNTNPSYQDGDRDTQNNNQNVKATAHHPGMNYDGSLNTKYGK